MRKIGLLLSKSVVDHVLTMLAVESKTEMKNELLIIWKVTQSGSFFSLYFLGVLLSCAFVRFQSRTS